MYLVYNILLNIILIIRYYLYKYNKNNKIIKIKISKKYNICINITN